MTISPAVLATGTARDIRRSISPGVVAYIGISGIVLLLMMLLGLVLRLAQAEWLSMPPDLFYEVMTAHGVGMVGIAGLAGAGIMWHFLSRHVRLSQGILVANLVLFLAGVVMILAAIYLGGFGGGWTFLYPLPATSGGVWEPGAAALYLSGLLVIGVGFLLFYLDAGRAIIAEYGGLGAALGWPVLFGIRQARLPEPTVVASAMVTIVNTVGLVSGAAVLAISLINIAVPNFAIDPLLAKNMTYFFGHVFINATIYMTVIAVYAILPAYTGREWKASKPFLWAWTASTVLVLIAYPHHLLMDFVMPRWALILGQVASYAAGLPVLVVTAYGALTLVLSQRHPLGRGVFAVVSLDVRLGRRDLARDHRCHDHGQPRDAQHDVGAGPFPFLFAARHGRDGLRLHVLCRARPRVQRRPARSIGALAIRVGRARVLAGFPVQRQSRRAAPLGRPPRGVGKLRPARLAIRARRDHGGGRLYPALSRPRAAPARSAMRLRALVTGLVVVVAGLAAIGGVTDGFRVVTTEGARRLAVTEHPRPLPDTTLVDQSGRTFRLSALGGRPVLVEYFYTSCPDICGLLVSQFQALLDRLVERPGGREILFSASVSIRRMTLPPSSPTTPLESAPMGTSGALPASPIRTSCQRCSTLSASSYCPTAPAVLCTTLPSIWLTSMGGSPASTTRLRPSVR